MDQGVIKGRPLALGSGLQALIRLGQEVWARQAGALRLAALLGILLFNFWAGMGPHWDYRYPLHVDEWFGIGYAQSTLDAGALVYPSPYGSNEIGFHPEMGFHLILGFLQSATGLSWMGLFRIAPGILLALLAFLTYAFGRRTGFGWAAALFVPLIPTSIRTLGPAFLVPVSVAMLSIPVTLLVLHTMEGESRGKSLWILMVLIGGTIFVHPTTEGLVTALAAFYLAGLVAEALFQRRFRDGINLMLAMGVRLLVPVVVLLLWLPNISKVVLVHSARGFSGTVALLGIHSGFTSAFGTGAVVIALIGIFLFLYRNEYGVRSYVLPLFTVLLTAFLINFPRSGLGPEPLYDRGWSYLGLFLAILGGYAVAQYFRFIPTIASALAAWVHRPLYGWIAAFLGAVGLAIMLAALLTGLATNQRRQGYQSYYHVVSEQTASDFSWIGRHAVDEQIVAFGDPTVTWAYPPIAGPGAQTFEPVSAPFSTPDADAMRAMVRSGQVDIAWLRERGISVLFTGGARLSSPILYEIRQGTYLVPPSSPAEGQ